MKKNTALKKAIKAHGYKQREFAPEVGMTEYQLSMAVTGRLNLRADEKLRIAAALCVPLRSLFPEDFASCKNA